MAKRLRKIWVVNAGRIAYGPAFDLQRRIVAARKAGAVPDILLFCEHPHVITLGRNGDTKNLLAGQNVLKQMNVEFAETDRGGDITYHGPGQIIGYPILDLTQHKRDVRWYVEQLEEVMIRAAGDYGLAARRVLCRHGIWIAAPNPESSLPEPSQSSGVGAAQFGPARQGWVNSEKTHSAVGTAQPSAEPCGSKEEKLAALGVHLSRWVTSHGFAFNVSTDLRFFDLIIPCGIKDKRATSLERALGRAVSLDEARTRLAFHFSEIFQTEPETKSFAELKSSLDAKIPAAL
jgi:lipoyl(octanoyl) transferase